MEVRRIETSRLIGPLISLKRLTNIKPNAVNGLRIHRPTEFQQCWEELLTKIKFFTDWNVFKHLGFKNVQTSVDDDMLKAFLGDGFSKNDE